MFKENLINLYEKKYEETYPLVCFITNYATVLDLVDMCIHSGGSPVLSDEIEEAHDMVEYSKTNAVVMNLGTINRPYLELMVKTGKTANRLGVPIVLDPAAIAASSFRKEALETLLKEVKFSIIKGNLGELKFILGYPTKNKGIDSFENEEGAEKYCIDLAKKLKTVVVMTGKVDIITDGQRVAKVYNGNERLKKICGMGSSVASIMGTYSGLTKDYFLSATLGAGIMGVASEMAEERMNDGQGIRSFKGFVHDAVYLMTVNDLEKKLKVENLIR